MDGITTEIAQKIGVLLEDERLRTPARANSNPSIKPGGSAPRDAALHFETALHA